VPTRKPRQGTITLADVQNVTDAVAGAFRGAIRAGSHRDRPVAPYGRHGVNVWLQPIPGLTPPGIFGGKSPGHPLGAPFQFQCPPLDTLGEDGSANHNDYSTVSSGQHSSFVGRDLRTVQLQTLFVDWQPSWSLIHDANWRPNPRKAVDELCRIRDRGKPFHLLAHQPGLNDVYDINYAATLRSVHWEARAGEIDGYYVTLQFSEFTTPHINEFLAGSRHHPHLPASMTVAHLPANRNTLAKMAKFYYGDPSKARLIATKNGITNIGNNTVITPKNVATKKITVPVVNKTAKKRGQRPH
jgi:hypothetical protein